MLSTILCWLFDAEWREIQVCENGMCITVRVLQRRESRPASAPGRSA